MDVARGILVQGHRLQQYEVLFCRLLNINQFEKNIFPFEDVGVGLLADLTLEFLPVVACDILAVFLGVPLSSDPILEALEVN
jgi:hypothetical protein